MKNICFVLGSFNIGGAEDHVLQIIKKIDKKLFNVYIAVLVSEGELKNKFINLGIPIYDIYPYGYSHLKFFLNLTKLIRFKKFLKEKNIEIIHIHHVGSFLIGVYGAYLAKIDKKIITWHSSYCMSTKKTFNFKINYFRFITFLRIIISANAVNTIIAVSQKVKEDNCKKFIINKKKVIVVYNGITPTKFCKNKFSLHKNSFTIVAVGNLKWQKNYLKLLAVIKETVKKNSAIKLEIIGEGPDRTKLEKYIRSNNLQNKVSLLGVKYNVQEILYKYDLYIIVSVLEGFSIALLEAMNSAMPIIASDVGGNKEALKYGKCGIIVPPNNTQKIGEALLKMLKDENQREVLANNARQYFLLNFTTKLMLNNLEDIYTK